MFSEFANQVWTTSGTGVVVTNNTDTSIDGSSRQVVWTNASAGYVNIAFTAVILSAYEEISFHIYVRDQLSVDDLFTVDVGGSTFTFTREELKMGAWNHILIDCSSMASVSSMRITSLVDDLFMFIDYIGYRRVTYDCDVDIIEALKDHINLDYGVATTLSAAAETGDNQISLTSSLYISDSSALELNDGAGVTEEVDLISQDGQIGASLVNDFPSGSVVTVLCPVRSEEYDNLEPDPICGIMVYDMDVQKRMDTIKTKDGSKIKEYLGSIGICIYIDCSVKKKLLQLAREFNRKYGKEFQFLLDGEQVDIYLDNSLFNDAILGSNPRIAYYYRLEPQPYTYANRAGITTFTVEMESVQ